MTNDAERPEETQAQDLRPRASNTIVAVLIAAGIIIGVFIFHAVNILIPEVIPAPLLKYEIRGVSAGEFCPGERVEQTLRIQTTELAKIQIDSTFEREDGSAVIPGILERSVIVHVRPGDRDTKSAWIVPSLEPGNYTRTLGAHAPGRNVEQFMAVTPFTVSEDCKPYENGIRRHGLDQFAAPGVPAEIGPEAIQTAEADR